MERHIGKCVRLFFAFFFKDADTLFDMEKGFQFLDKELEQLFPNDEGEAPKFADKLVKVFTKAGAEEWLLVNIEVQGYDDKDFAKRMFTYFYRILGKYNKPFTAFAIFTDSRKNFHPKAYKYEHLGTKNTYQYNTYKIRGQDEAALANDENPFAVVVLTVLLALKKKKLADEDLLNLKMQIFRNLYRRSINEQKMQGLQTFLNFYVRFAKWETTDKFKEEIQTLTENKKTMGTVEMVLERAKKEGRKLGMEEGIEQGIEKGIEQGIEKGIESKATQMVTNLLLAKRFTVSEIANFANVTEAFVIEVREGL